ncbi:SDR family NAD(P)-dependent oxidoreductase [Nocardia noduli]|uniref:SDR family NAD(P)-dependent oxidoreductase n=1 Tax=Nocardia noduli TaxID=2815722 RepID=UPI001C22844D|nr:SDR family NAD(P)-dependent oxidoreductase [Nocardia noduli]
MGTVVITGGTDGMGKALALSYLERGEQVVIIGTDTRKAQSVLDAATKFGAGERVDFIQADLSLVTETRRVIEHITSLYSVVDVLVLGARFFRARRFVTMEGFEATFALFYLSRYLLGHGLVAQLDRAETPVILDLAGPGGPLSAIHWDDIQFEHSYDPGQVMAQCGKLSDLLAVAFIQRYPQSRVRYVLLHPGLTATGFTGEYDTASAEAVARMRERGQPIHAALTRIRRHLDTPPRESLTAFMQDNRIEVHGEPFDPAAAQRLSELTSTLLQQCPQGE